ncbi:MAG: aminotransferase class I/II-fold pyridoxal phosphate-dependent enzyme [Acholeplasmatales bacterium]|nr:aminotransferase class I/II-fold pyridoxal phosphate-dependent enzyme [Acholeplasmatales bacterium]
MRDFVPDKIKNIKPSGIRKFFDVASEVKGAISLGVGEPDFQTPWHVREQGIYALERGKTHYTSNAGLITLREEICNYVKRKYNLSYEPKKNVLITIGGSEAIDMIIRSTITSDDEVIITKPCYVSYEPLVILQGGSVKEINLKSENKFKLTKEELLSNITKKTKMIIMNYPNNPTGGIMTKADLEEIAPILIEHDILVVSDEIYSELSYKENHISIASLPGMKERTIVINGFSKAFAMTGWRLGYALGPENLISQMTKIHQFAIMCAPTVSQYAAVEALKYGDDDVKLMRESYNQRRLFCLDKLNEMGIECFEPEGAFYLFPSIKKYGLSSEDFSMKLLNEEKLVVVPGTAFGDAGEGFIRISYAYSIESLTEAFKRLKRFVSKFNK